MTEERSFVIYTDGAFCSVIGRGSATDIPVPGADLSSIKVVDEKTFKSVRFDVVPESWIRDSVILTRTGELKGRILESSDKFVKFIESGSGAKKLITTKYENISTIKMLGNDNDEYLVILPNMNGNIISYNTDILSWDPIISINTFENGEQASLIMDGRIKSGYNEPIKANISLIMKERHHVRIRDESSEPRAMMMSRGGRSSVTEEEESNDIGQPDVDLGMLMVTNMTSVPISNEIINIDKTEVVNLQLTPIDGKAISSIATFATSYLPSARYNIMDKRVYNSVEMKSHQKGELIILPIASSRYIRYQTKINTAENRVPDGLSGTRVESVKHIITTKIINTFNKNLLVTFVLKNYNELISIDPKPSLGSTQTTYYWTIDSPPGEELPLSLTIEVKM